MFFVLNGGLIVNLFITGGSGFIGESILARLLGNSQYKTIYVLIRPKKRRSAEGRINELIRKITPPELIHKATEKIKAISGDITMPKLGMSKSDIEKVSNSVNQILHTAASVDFGLPIKASREINVEGTRKVIELAEACMKRGSLKRFDYVSTAFVGGIKKGEFTEDDLVCGQSFANAYEQSKYEAELLLNKYKTKFPITIYRPSVVVGDSRTGYTTHFNVIYWPIRMLAKGYMRFIIPHSPRSKIDIVPVDFVTDSIVALMQSKDSLGETFHLTAGQSNQETHRTIIKDVCKIMQLKPPLMVPFWVFDRLICGTPLKRIFPKKYWDIIDLAKHYGGYFRGKSVSFNTEKTKKRLMRYNIAVPEWDSYKHNILEYCLETQWGKRHKQPQYKYHYHLYGTKDKDVL